MIGWLILAACITLILIFFKFKGLRHRTFSVVLILLIIFFYITLTQVAQKQNVNLGTVNGWVVTGQAYFSWLGHAIVNVKGLAGNAIKMDWMGNSSSGG